MRPIRLTALLLSTGLAVSAQTVISAHSGVLHLVEGSVSIDGKPVVQKYGTFPDWKEKSELRTGEGRAEILLTPGVFLRVGEVSAVRLIDNRLSATRVELISGEVVVEADDPMKENDVTLVYGDYEVRVRKNSVFTMESQPAQLKVFNGEASVGYQSDAVTVKAGHLLPFTAALAMEKFDPKDGDILTRWSRRRGESIAAANVSSAKSLRDSGTTMGSSGWYYNPYYSMYTYMPLGGTIWSPYGYGFFSPGSIYSYLPYGYGYGGNGYRGGAIHSGDTSGNFGRGSTTTTASSTGFGRGSSSVGSGSVGSGVSSGAASSGGFSGGGRTGGGGGGGRGTK